LDHARRWNRQGRLAADAADAGLYRRRTVAAEDGFLRLRAGSPQAVASGYGTQGPSFVGWHAKGGVEWMFIPGWSAKLEYDHADWGSHTVSGAGLLYGATPAAISAQQSQFLGTKRFTEESVRVGLAYHTNFFGGNNGLFFLPTGNAGADLATFNSNVQTTIGNVNSAIQSHPPAQGIVGSAIGKAGL
jgi:hypothetical protein